MRDDLNSKINQATKWSGITEIATKLIAPITNAVLARLLVPEAFGVVATLTMVVSFAEIFTDAGFQKYLVQHDFVDQDDLDKSTNVAFWTNLGLSLLIWAVIAIFATPIATLVGSAGCEQAIVVMCAQIPLLAFSSIQMARYRRDFDFRTLFVVRMVTAAVPLVITVPLAIFFRSYWALVAGTLARDLINAVILTAKSPWKPKLEYALGKLNEMLSYSLWIIVENITIWLTINVGVFIIGSLSTSYYVGLYKTATSTVNSYMNLFYTATAPVLFSGLSRYQNDEQAFRQTFFKFQRLASLLVVPLGFGLFVYRELATSILLGDQWTETADLLGLWSLAAAIVLVLGSYNSEVFRSKGRPRLSVLVQVFYLLAMIPALVWGAKNGFEALSVAGPSVRLVIVLISGIIMSRAVKIRFWECACNVWPAFLAAALMAAAGMYLRTLLPGMLWEIVTVFMCVVVYGVAMLLIPAGKKQLAEIPILKKLLKL